MRSLIRGTFCRRDLIKTFAEELARMDVSNNQIWGDDYRWLERAAKGEVDWPSPYSPIWDQPTGGEAFDWLKTQLSARAASGEFFGTNPNDPTELGFWPEPPTPPPLSEMAEALGLAVKLIDSLLPQMGRISVDVGLLNDTLIKARPLLAQFKATQKAQ